MYKLLFKIPFVVFSFMMVSNFLIKNEDHEMTICTIDNKRDLTISRSNEGKNIFSKEILFDLNPLLSYSMPLLTKFNDHQTILTWTEKDEKGENSLCMSISENSNLNFSEKKVIYKGSGLGNSRMMRAKVLIKNNGNMVAVFSNREEVAVEPGKKPKRALNIVYCESTDHGNSWSSPKAVDTDPAKVVRGFFDAIVLPNNELAVVYLKDVENSTKHEERNLRLALTKNGIFQPEKIIDPVVCDCCPINLYLDQNLNLNVVYRDNNDDIRDMAKMVSYDNATTFSKPEIIYQDNWKITGCPHQGALSTKNNKEGYLVWFTGAESEQGYRLTDFKGHKIDLINDATAKDPWLTSNETQSVLLWQQNKNSTQISMVAMKSLQKNITSETSWIENTENTVNVSAQIINNQIVIAREVLGKNKKNLLAISYANL